MSKVKEEAILDVGYDRIFEHTNKNYQLSLNYLNYEPKYVSHLNSIFEGDLSYITLICDPFNRVLTHFYYSNSFKTIYDFNEYYRHFSKMDNVGWTGLRDRTNNYFTHYFGFKSEEEITKENVQQRFALVMVSEHKDKSLEKLGKIFKNNKIKNLDLSLKIHSNTALDYTKREFIKNNELDYKLYDICCELLLD